MFQELKQNDRVLINPEGVLRTYADTRFGEFRKRRIYGILQSGALTKKHVEGGYKLEEYNLSVSFLNSQVVYNIKQSDLILPPKEEYEKSKQVSQEYVAELFKLDYENAKKFGIPAKGTYSEINVNRNISYGTNNPKRVLTQYVFGNRCSIDFRNGKITDNATPGYMLDCCDPLKDRYDINFFLPLYYLNYYGYTVYDVHKWLQFLENCNIGFKYILEGEVGLPDIYKPYIQDKKCEEEYLFLPTNSIVYPTNKSKFLEI